MLQRNSARKIRQFIFSLPEGKLFSSRDLLQYGSRCAIDQNLSRLAQLGVIVRITRGVFMRDTADGKRPSVRAVAFAKAEAFCKDIIDVPPGFPIEQPKENVKIFLCPSSGARFEYGDTTIIFKRISARKFYDLKDAEMSEKYPSAFDCSPEAREKKLSSFDYFPSYKSNKHSRQQASEKPVVEYEFVVAEDIAWASSF